MTKGLEAVPADVIFENVRILNGTSDRLSAPSNVLVVANTIKAISSAPIAAPPGTSETRIQGGGRTLMPGLIDDHVHLVMSASSQQDLIDPKVSRETLQTRASEEARLMLLRGFTAVRDLGGPMLDARKSIDQGTTPGPRIYPSGAMISQTSGHGGSRLPHERSRRFGGAVSRGELLGANFIADGRDEVLTATRENLRAGATQIKVRAGGWSGLGLRSPRRGAIYAGCDEGSRRGGRRLGNVCHGACVHAQGGATGELSGRQLHRAWATAG